MSRLSPFLSHLAVAAAALGFAHSCSLLALEGDPSRLLLESAISDAQTALRYLRQAAAAVDNTRPGKGDATVVVQ
jgi:hypothetical protein